MTHLNDCTITRDGEYILDEAADIFYNELPEVREENFFDPELTDREAIDATEEWKEQQIKWHGERHGLELQAEGSGRLVFVQSQAIGTNAEEVEGCVVKVAKMGSRPEEKFADGRKQNKKEISTWRDAPDELRDLLVPIKDWDRDYMWLSMPFVRPTYNPHHVEQMKDKLRDAGWMCDDVNRENVGKLHGDLVLLDYGNGCSPLSY